MEYVVLLKQVINPDVEVGVGEDGRSPVFGRREYVVNEADEYALEAALRLRERTGGRVTVVSLGPMRVREALYTAMAKGADRGVHVSVEEDSVLSDPRLTAAILSKAVSSLGYELVLAGSEAFDTLASQVGVLVAEFLGIPHVSAVSGIEPYDNGLMVRRELGEGFNAELFVKTPALLTIQYGIYSLRYAPVLKVLEAKRRGLTTLRSQDLGLGGEELKPKLTTLRLFKPPRRRETRFITGSPPEAARLLVGKLREAKVV